MYLPYFGHDLDKKEVVGILTYVYLEKANSLVHFLVSPVILAQGIDKNVDVTCDDLELTFK